MYAVRSYASHCVNCTIGMHVQVDVEQMHQYTYCHHTADVLGCYIPCYDEVMYPYRGCIHQQLNALEPT